MRKSNKQEISKQEISKLVERFRSGGTVSNEEFEIVNQAILEEFFSL